MLKRLLGRLVSPPAPPAQPEAHSQEGADAMEAYAFLSAVAAAMPSLNPPPAANDDSMDAVQNVVEYAMVHAGYLR